MRSEAAAEVPVAAIAVRELPFQEQAAPMESGKKTKIESHARHALQKLAHTRSQRGPQGTEDNEYSDLLARRHHVQFPGPDADGGVVRRRLGLPFT